MSEVEVTDTAKSGYDKTAWPVQYGQILRPYPQDLLGVMNLLLWIGERAQGEQRRIMVGMAIDRLGLHRTHAQRLVAVARAYFITNKRQLQLARMALGDAGFEYRGE